MARNFYEFNEELEKTNNPYRNTVQMTHGAYVSPYQQFKQQYPEIDAYGNKVLSGGYLKDNLRRFKQAGRNARLELQGQKPETEDNLMDYFAPIAMTAGKLPMDEISRLARAKEMGFDTNDVMYHGTLSGKFNEFDLSAATKSNAPDTGGSIWFSNKKEAAEGYMRNDYGDYSANPFLHETYLKINKPYKTDKILNNKQIEHLKKQGYDGIVTSIGDVAVFSPKQIRSVRAKFDTRYKNSGNLLE